MAIDTFGAGDNVINGHVIRRAANQVTSCPDGSKISGCTFAQAYEDAIEAELPTVAVGDLKDGEVNKVVDNPLTPVQAPTSFVQSGDAVTPWNQSLTVFIGSQYSNAGQTWICRQTHQSQSNWSPGSIGVDALWTKVSFSLVWEIGVAYVVGDERYYPTVNDTLYRCLQSHQSIASWTPPIVPALWSVV
jgi:hypothetical protein